MLLVLLGVAIATVLFYLWRYLTEINKYFEERGVPHLKPKLFIGNNGPMWSKKADLAQLHRDEYQSFPNTPIYGRFDHLKPYYVVKDLELVEKVLIKDFQHFVDHGYMTADSKNPIDVNLFNMNGKQWKAMRNKLSPMFTTGKLRGITPLLSELCDSVVTVLERNPKNVDAKDLLQKFTIEVIASVAFGLDVNTILEEEESEFVKMSKRALKFTFPRIARILFLTLLPNLARTLKVSQTESKVAKYFSKVIEETLAYRKNTKLSRNDFVQQLLMLQEKGSVEFEADDVDNDYLKVEGDGPKTEQYELTNELMVGHAFIFLVAGNEGTTNALQWMCYELAVNPECQAAARREVKAVVDTRKGVLDYDAVKAMTYLDQCVKETMRLHTFSAITFRICTKEYTFPGTKITVKPGENVLIPVVGIHMDPNIYPEPNEFRPDRFDPDVKRPNCSYLPFGDGPRICIAMRFALTEIKVCMARILLDYGLELSATTKLPIEMDLYSYGNPKSPLYFNFVKKN